MVGTGGFYHVRPCLPPWRRLSTTAPTPPPPLPYAGRTCVAGRIDGSGGGRSLHLSGHVDVVPVEAEERWTHDPWGGEIAGGRLWGRGAGDMKSGNAAHLVAVEAALETAGALGGGRPLP